MSQRTSGGLSVVSQQLASGQTIRVGLTSDSERIRATSARPVRWIASARSLVGNGRKATVISSRRFSRMTVVFAKARRRMSPWWTIHSPPIVRKLVA